jgi:hypothetical protein
MRVIAVTRETMQNDQDGVILLMATRVECPLIMTAIKELVNIQAYGF